MELIQLGREIIDDSAICKTGREKLQKLKEAYSSVLNFFNDERILNARELNTRANERDTIHRILENKLMKKIKEERTLLSTVAPGAAVQVNAPVVANDAAVAGPSRPRVEHEPSVDERNQLQETPTDVPLNRMSVSLSPMDGLTAPSSGLNSLQDCVVMLSILTEAAKFPVTAIINEARKAAKLLKEIETELKNLVSSEKEKLSALIQNKGSLLVSITKQLNSSILDFNANQRCIEQAVGAASMHILPPEPGSSAQGFTT